MINLIPKFIEKGAAWHRTKTLARAPQIVCSTPPSAAQRFFMRYSCCIQPSVFGSCSPGCLHASLGSLLGGCVQQVYHLAPGVVRLIKDPTPDYHLVYK